MVLISKGEEAVVVGRLEELVRPLESLYLKTKCNLFIRLMCVCLCVYRALASPFEREIDIGCFSMPASLLAGAKPGMEILLCNG